MKTVRILFAALAIPALFAASAYAGGSCCSKDKKEEKKEAVSFSVNCDCGKKGEDGKKEA